LARGGKSGVEDVDGDDEEDAGYFQLSVDVRVKLRKHANYGVDEGEND
jgi:hypothetical protein